VKPAGGGTQHDTAHVTVPIARDDVAFIEVIEGKAMISRARARLCFSLCLLASIMMSLCLALPVAAARYFLSIRESRSARTAQAHGQSHHRNDAITGTPVGVIVLVPVLLTHEAEPPRK